MPALPSTVGTSCSVLRLTLRKLTSRKLGFARVRASARVWEREIAEITYILKLKSYFEDSKKSIFWRIFCSYPTKMLKKSMKKRHFSLKKTIFNHTKHVFMNIENFFLRISKSVPIQTKPSKSEKNLCKKYFWSISQNASCCRIISFWSKKLVCSDFGLQDLPGHWLLSTFDDPNIGPPSELESGSVYISLDQSICKSEWGQIS